MSVIIGADLVPTETNYDLFENAELETLFGNKLLHIVSKADFRIFNLETPITDNDTPIEKCGPALITPTRVMPGIKALGVDLFTIANNHILDQGEPGFNNTVGILKENKIDFVGGGKNLSEASVPYIFDFKEKKIGVYACAEHEFSIATEEKCGANPFDPLESLDHIVKLKNQCDFVIVLYHGGKEHYRYPSPNLQRICRKLVDKGADLVICQHSHCIGCEEKYNKGTIVYGQGNFIFDYSSSEFWQTSLLIELTENLDLIYIPIVKNKNTVDLPHKEDSIKILKAFEARSEEIRSHNFIEENYRDFSNSVLNNYLWEFYGGKTNILFRIINKLSGYRYISWIIKRRYQSAKLCNIQNFIECESIRELVVSGLKAKQCRR
ncbi:MAG: CapA family protein [Clostridia bacterium]|nr:CapA family protein [Clostridia bacterium]